ncbi:TPA: alpha/beta fold hydrolase, partial [Legionella pneumophila]
KNIFIGIFSMGRFKRVVVFFTIVMWAASSINSASIPIPVHDSLPSSASSHFANVNGIRLHYIEMGKGPLVILLHGWPETSFSWRLTIRSLSSKYRVVAPDLRGLGLSEHTQNGYDKKTIATDIKALIEYLGETQAVIIGHDMGGKAAYVMAHLYPKSVSKLILVDCTIPGTENSDALHGGAWHYGFHMAPEIPEMLTKGREKEYIRAQIKVWLFNKGAIDEDTIDEYVKHYATNGGMTAGFNYYRALKEDAALVETFHNQKLMMPVLTITGRHSVGDKLAEALENEATSLKSIIVADSGHFVPEETPEIFNSSVLKFLESVNN